MKLSLLALILCIGLLTWNAWLQIQVVRLSHSGLSPTNLKLSSLEIVDADGNTVVEMQGTKKNSGIKIQDTQGGRTVLLGSKILVANKQANELAILDSNSFQLSTVTGDTISEVCALRNGTGWPDFQFVPRLRVIAAGPSHRVTLLGDQKRYRLPLMRRA